MTKRSRLTHEGHIALIALCAGLPSTVAAMTLLYLGGYSAKVLWTFGALLTGCWLGFALSVRERVALPLRTIANLLEAMREGDYSIRGRQLSADDSLGEVLIQVNAMGATLQSQRLGALEATTLLRKVMEEINVAVFIFDQDRRLRLVNRAGERLLADTATRLTGRNAAELGLADCLEGDERQTLQRTFPGGAGRWGLSRSAFREEGRPHQLLVLTDLTRALREEELQAWQRLVRVLGHELNNSLTPIKSIAGSLETIMSREPLPEDWRDDMQRGLSIIATRSESLRRFLESYAKLAKLPPPKLAPVPVAPLVRHVVQLETRLAARLHEGPELTIQADADQLQQVLINLLRNAVDAARDTGGGVEAGWEQAKGMLEIWIRDEGRGLANTNNLFVPFFTTKPHGSGIGLVLSRQIVEHHDGLLTLTNRLDRSGCEARVSLPLG